MVTINRINLLASLYFHAPEKIEKTNLSGILKYLEGLIFQVSSKSNPDPCELDQEGKAQSAQQRNPGFGHSN